MLKELFDRVLEVGKQKTGCDGDIMWENGKAMPRPETLATRLPESAPRRLRSIQGVVDLAAVLKSAMEPLDHIHVSHYFVELVGPIGPLSRRREKYASYKYEEEPFPFGRLLGAKAFVAMLRSRFVHTEVSKQVEKFIFGTKIEDVREVDSKDGIGVEVLVRRGLSNTEWAAMPRSLELRPHRTFPEVEQPLGSFALRVEGDKEPLFALDDSDGGRWKFLCSESVKEHTKTLVKVAGLDLPVIG